jgi:hypothetical protein
MNYISFLCCNFLVFHLHCIRICSVSIFILRRRAAYSLPICWHTLSSEHRGCLEFIKMSQTLLLISAEGLQYVTWNIQQTCSGVWCTVQYSCSSRFICQWCMILLLYGLYGLFNAVAQTIYYRMRGRLVNNVWKGYKDVVKASFIILPWNLSAGTEEDTKTSITLACVMPNIQRRQLTTTSKRHCYLSLHLCFSFNH